MERLKEWGDRFLLSRGWGKISSVHRAEAIAKQLQLLKPNKPAGQDWALRNVWRGRCCVCSGWSLSADLMLVVPLVVLLVLLLFFTLLLLGFPTAWKSKVCFKPRLMPLALDAPLWQLPEQDEWTDKTAGTLCLFGYLYLKILPSSLFPPATSHGCGLEPRLQILFVWICLQALCSATWKSQWDLSGTSGNAWVALAKQVCCKENLWAKHQELSSGYRKGLFSLWFRRSGVGVGVGFFFIFLFLIIIVFSPETSKSSLKEQGADEQVSLFVEVEKYQKPGGHSWPLPPVFLQITLCASLPQKRINLMLMSVLKAMDFASRTLNPSTAIDSMFTFFSSISA